MLHLGAGGGRVLFGVSIHGVVACNPVIVRYWRIRLSTLLDRFEAGQGCTSLLAACEHKVNERAAQ